ncbi:MAG: type II toxin-antitoxin system RelE/ParE family toxin [Bryobacteraceae bacterium]|jgi:plasmid stabilization system protein ParE
MTYRVELTDRAARDLVILCEDKNVAGSVAAARWYNGLEKAVYTLETHPGRCQMAPESGRAGRPLRHLLYGKKPHVYRVIYAIDERKKLVRVLTIRHPAMAPAALHE